MMVVGYDDAFLAWDERTQRDSPWPQRLSYSRIPEKYWSSTWDDYDLSAKDAENYPAAYVLQDWVQDVWIDKLRRSDQGIVLLGEPGYGKTMGMALALMDAMRAGAWGQYTTYANLVQREITSFREEKYADEEGSHWRREYLNLYNIRERVDVLFLDDVGKEHTTGSRFAEDYLDALLRGRNDKGKATLITSNLLPDEWDRYGVSTWSFLSDIGEVFSITQGFDHRQKRARPARRVI